MLYLTKKMNSRKTAQVIKQLNQSSEERFPKQKKEGSDGNVVREIIFDNSKESDVFTGKNKEEEQAFAKRRIAELEAEIREMALKRQREARERYKQEEKKDEVQQEASHDIPSGRPKRGFGIRRIKTAQQQSQPETAGRRVAG